MCDGSHHELMRKKREEAEAAKKAKADEIAARQTKQ
jgi:hypothetical protein